MSAVVGRPVGVSDLESFVQKVAQQTANNHSSMLRDLLQKRKTEIDYINGYLVSQAEKLGLEVPVNRTLLRLVRLKERLGAAEEAKE